MRVAILLDGKKLSKDANLNFKNIDIQSGQFKNSLGVHVQNGFVGWVFPPGVIKNENQLNDQAKKDQLIATQVQFDDFISSILETNNQEISGKNGLILPGGELNPEISLTGSGYRKKKP